MAAELLKQVVDLAADQPYVWLATTDDQARPHLTTAGGLFLADDEHVVVREWFCPATVANAEARPAASIVVWPGGPKEGYQLVGRVESVRERSVMDGFDPSRKHEPPLPQVQREMTVRIEQVLEFRHGPHSDESHPVRT